MRRVYFLILLFSALKLYSFEHKLLDENRKNNFAVTFNVSPVTLYRHSFPLYKNLNKVPNPYYFDYEKALREQDVKKVYVFDRYNLYVKYQLNSKLYIGLGAQLLKEEIRGINSNFDTIAPLVYKVKGIGYLNRKYLSFPVFVSYSTSENFSQHFQINFDGGFNFDFVYYEWQETGKIIIDSIYPPNNIHPLIVKNISYEVLPKNPRNNKYDFNRLSPFVSVNVECFFNSNRTFAFNFGTTLVFKSIYQLKNTSEYYKIFKYTPLNLGLSYYIK